MPKWSWPLVWRSSHDALKRENFELRGAIRMANAELQKHRMLIVGLKTGQPEITAAFEKAIK
jgi:hypothetical protein